MIAVADADDVDEAIVIEVRDTGGARRATDGGRRRESGSTELSSAHSRREPDRRMSGSRCSSRCPDGCLDRGPRRRDRRAGLKNRRTRREGRCRLRFRGRVMKAPWASRRSRGHRTSHPRRSRPLRRPATFLNALGRAVLVGRTGPAPSLYKTRPSALVSRCDVGEAVAIEVRGEQRADDGQIDRERRRDEVAVAGICKQGQGAGARASSRPTARR